MMPRIDFWYDFASTYSYLAATRVGPLAEAAGISLAWRPFLLGPIFKSQGWVSSPFSIYPVKGRYAWRDMERLAARQGLPKFSPPNLFPAHSLLAARVALVLSDQARPDFTRAVYRAEFAEGRDIADRSLIAEILRELGHDAGTVLAKTGEQTLKDKLRIETEEAVRCRVFGAPSFITEDGELFWGNDRLEQALEWARGKKS